MRISKHTDRLLARILEDEVDCRLGKHYSLFIAARNKQLELYEDWRDERDAGCVFMRISCRSEDADDSITAHLVALGPSYEHLIPTATTC